MPIMFSYKNLTYLCVIKFLLLIGIACFSLIALAPDEAQYWTWSQALDFGYYSKPPAISWQIFLTTTLLGNNEIGVRLGAMIIGTLLTISLYFLAKRANLSDQVAFFSATIFALSPMGFYLSFAATTDGGAILFLVLALFPLIKGLTSQKEPNYVLFGMLIALGALYKWSIYVIWPMLALSLLLFPILRSKKIFIGFLISLLGFGPSLYWNMMHEWATFKHVFSTVVPSASHGNKGNFSAYLGAQISLLSPIFFLFLCVSIKKLRKAPSSLQFLALFLGAAFCMLLLSCFKKMQPNWAMYLYPPLVILMGWSAIEKTRLFFIGSLVSVAMIMISVCIPLLQNSTLFPLSYKLNPYRQNMGVRTLGLALAEVGYDPSQDILFADKYQNASLLSFYGEGQKRAYFFNLGGARKNQFSYWTQMPLGKRGYFVVIENKTTSALSWYEKHYQEHLSPYFASVSYVGSKVLFHAVGEGVKHVLIFKCEGYLGTLPPEVDSY